MANISFIGESNMTGEVKVSEWITLPASARMRINSAIRRRKLTGGGTCWRFSNGGVCYSAYVSHLDGRQLNDKTQLKNEILRILETEGGFLNIRVEIN